MFVNRTTLRNILENNVCEIKFLRKREKPNHPLFRRMLCTRAVENIFNKNRNFLDSPAGINILHFKKPPSYPRKRLGMTYNWEEKSNLLMVWDIFMQNWRVINVQTCNLIWSIPADENFWYYFNTALSKMTAQQKLEFQDK